MKDVLFSMTGFDKVLEVEINGSQFCLKDTISRNIPVRIKFRQEKDLELFIEKINKAFMKSHYIKGVSIGKEIDLT